MNEIYSHISDLLQQLANSLDEDSKDETALHLRSLRQRLMDENRSDAALEEISKMAPLVQYADFSNDQERTLAAIQHLAQTVKGPR